MIRGQFIPIAIEELWTDHFEREVWKLHMEGKSIPEIAKELDYPEDTVHDAIIFIWYKERRPHDFRRYDG